MTVRIGVIGSFEFPLDECVFIFFDPECKVLAGILCLHVDDPLLGCCGTACRQTVNALRSRFPFRNGKEIKENSVVGMFPRMFSSKRSLSLRIPTP